MTSRMLIPSMKDLFILALCILRLIGKPANVGLTFGNFILKLSSQGVYDSDHKLCNDLFVSTLLIRCRHCEAMGWRGAAVGKCFWPNSFAKLGSVGTNKTSSTQRFHKDLLGLLGVAKVPTLVRHRKIVTRLGSLSLACLQEVQLLPGSFFPPSVHGTLC